MKYLLILLFININVFGGSINGLIDAGNPTNFLDYCNGQYSFRYSSLRELNVIVGSSSNATTQLIYNNIPGSLGTIGNVWSINTNCWTISSGLDMSGLARQDGIGGHYLPAISSNYGVFPHHLESSLAANIVFVDTTGALITNSIASYTYDTNTIDLDIVKFSNPLPPTVHPFKLLPSNYRTFIPGKTIYTTNMSYIYHYQHNPFKVIYDGIFGFIWFKPNTGGMNCVTCAYDNYNGNPSDLIMFDDINNYGTYEPFDCSWGVTAGDSSGPVFLVINQKAVLVMVTYTGNDIGFGPDGPNIADSIGWLQTNMTDNLNFVDLSKYSPF